MGIRIIDLIPITASLKIRAADAPVCRTVVWIVGTNRTIIPPINIDPAAMNRAAGIPKNSAMIPLASAPTAATARVPTEWTAMAFIRASRGTMSVISPCFAGISKELTTPWIDISTKIGHGLENPFNAMSAVIRIVVAMISAVRGNKRFRGNRSATAPPIGAAIMPGADLAANVAAESKTEFVCSSTNHPTARRSAHVPSATKLALNHRRRYAGYSKTANGFGDRNSDLRLRTGGCDFDRSIA